MELKVLFGWAYLKYQPQQSVLPRKIWLLRVKDVPLFDIFIIIQNHRTFPHSSHWHSSWARLKCLGRAEGCLNNFPHFGHGTCCLPCSVIMCSFNASGLSFFPHSLQTSVLSSPLCSRNLLWGKSGWNYQIWCKSWRRV